MTKFLVSVRNLNEAILSAKHGADIIDVKEPRRGSLGAAALEVVAEIADRLSGQVAVSAACGELLDAVGARHARLPENLSFAKFGLAGCHRDDGWQDLLRAAWAGTSRSIEKVAVAYADWQACLAPNPAQVVEFAAENSCKYFLLDTSDKQLSLLASIPHHAIDGWIEAARAANLTVAIAGSLRAADLPMVARRWSPDVIAVRGAVCSGTRESAICPEKVRELTAVINQLSCQQARTK